MSITTFDDRVFDRRPSGDRRRSAAFPMRDSMTELQPRDRRWTYHQTDQGHEGACVGHGVTQEAAARPKPVFGDPGRVGDIGPMLNGFAYGVYKAAQAIDEWAGEDYEGTSVLAGMKIGQRLGWWKNYTWATGRDAATTVMLAVGWNGPVVVGTWWHEGMFTMDRDGYLNPTGTKVGGHCYLLTATSVERDAVYTPNSWGGEGGGWIRKRDLRALLADDGEAALPVLRRR